MKRFLAVIAGHTLWIEEEPQGHQAPQDPEPPMGSFGLHEMLTLCAVQWDGIVRFFVCVCVYLYVVLGTDGPIEQSHRFPAV